jgi:hypothetical protein
VGLENRSFKNLVITGEKRRSTVIPIRHKEIGLSRNIKISPRKSMRDCLKLTSINGPRTKASIKGAGS